MERSRCDILSIKDRFFSLIIARDTNTNSLHLNINTYVAGDPTKLPWEIDPELKEHADAINERVLKLSAIDITFTAVPDTDFEFNFDDK